jgi:hypothetical protein
MQKLKITKKVINLNLENGKKMVFAESFSVLFQNFTVQTVGQRLHTLSVLHCTQKLNG